MISSDENIGDRPIRKHVGAISFSVLGFVVFVVLIAMLFIHFKKPDIGSPPKGETNQPTNSAQPQRVEVAPSIYLSMTASGITPLTVWTIFPEGLM